MRRASFSARACCRALSVSIVIILGLSASSALLFADFPYPRCNQCADPKAYASYLFLSHGVLPDDYVANSADKWKYEPATGMNVTGAWLISTGRPDVVSAVLDCGILWDRKELAYKVALNTGELPLPTGCQVYDCNGDGVVNVRDYADVLDSNGNGFVDAQDLIRAFSDGKDNDGNGYVDDIAGWDFFQGDNDPEDDVEFGHGTGQAAEQAGEANNGTGFPGVAPNVMFVPLRVSDSFVAVDTDFAQAVVYAVDRKVSLISEALGTTTASSVTQAAITYAYRRGVPIVASSADEQSYHHNYPAAFEHTIWVNSIRNGDGTFATNTNDYTILNGCTNYGAQAWIAVSSTGCSSEATSRAAGLAGLLISHGKNLVDRGLLTPYPGLETPFSAEEVRQILRWSAQDIDHSSNLSLGMNALLKFILSITPTGPSFGSSQFPSQAGWDQYTGYGRPDAAKLLSITAETIPPEADLSGGLQWFENVDPERIGSVPIIGSAAAARAPGSFSYRVEFGCGCQPSTYTELAASASSQPLREAVLASLNLSGAAWGCGFNPRAVIQDPNAHTVTIRLRVTDSRGNVGEDRRVISIHSDGSLRFPPLRLGSSAEASPVLADVNRDGVLDIVFATSDGAVRVLSGQTGRDLPGFPAWTDPISVHSSPAYSGGEVPIPREPIAASPAADDLDGDGRIEIVAASTEGKVYVFDDGGGRRPGFPVATDPTLSAPSIRDPYNDLDGGILGAPALADLDAPGQSPGLEIVVAAFDRHLYAWRADGGLVAGFPVRLVDPEKMLVGADGRASPKDPANTFEMGAKIVGSPAVGDLDGDGVNEIVVASGEQYSGASPRFVLDPLFNQLASSAGEIRVDASSRVYAVHHDGNLHPGGPFRSGWPAPVPLLAPGYLPTVGTGAPGSPALADVSRQGKLTTAIFSAAGPPVLVDPDGQPALGTDFTGAIRTMGMSPGGSAGSKDGPFFGMMSSGGFADLTGDGYPEYFAPTTGIRAALDLLAPGSQEFSHFQVTAWNPRNGSVLPAFPQVVEDMSFLGSPAAADVDGDGKVEVIHGTGGYMLRAYNSEGKQPSGWPKFTHGWIYATPSCGDVDGDGLIEVVGTTREGFLYVWDTPSAASPAALPWPGAGRDRRHTKNLSSAVSPLGGSEPRPWLRNTGRAGTPTVRRR